MRSRGPRSTAGGNLLRGPWRVYLFAGACAVLLFMICTAAEKSSQISYFRVQPRALLCSRNPKRENLFHYDGRSVRAMEGENVVVGPNITEERVLIRGSGLKGVNGPILSWKGAITIGQGSTEFRVVRLSYKVDYALMEDAEGAETDICLSILPVNSISPGGEILCSHEHVHGKVAPGRVEIALPKGGLRLKPGWRVDVRSVSSVWANTSMLRADSILVKREHGLVPPRTSNLLRLLYEVELIRADSLVVKRLPLITSVRSPQRDRSFMFSSAIEGVYGPFTPYKNIGDMPVIIEGVVAFVSALDHHPPVDSMVEVLIDDVIVLSLCLPLDKIGITDEKRDGLIEVGRVLLPGSVVTVRHKGVGANFVSMDVAFFILTTATSESLEPVELPFFHGVVDLNHDGNPDLVDIDSTGVMWAELTSADQKGAHDTQHVLVPQLPRSLNFSSSTVTFRIFGHESEHLPFAQLRDSSTSLCLNLHKLRAYRLTVKYCEETVPFSGDCAAAACRGNWEFEAARPVERSHAVDDFDGDGWLDRVRVSSDQNSSTHVYISFGGPQGLRTEKLWFQSDCCRGSGSKFTDRGRLIPVFDAARKKAVVFFDWGCKDWKHGSDVHPWCKDFLDVGFEYFR